nr:hypothetical protein [Nannocystis sp.]
MIVIAVADITSASCNVAGHAEINRATSCSSAALATATASRATGIAYSPTSHATGGSTSPKNISRRSPSTRV